VEILKARNEKLDKDVYGLLSNIRDLEREKISTKERLQTYEAMLVHTFPERS
jgi:hypothetical protein